ncbi:hypothetical protein Rleg9DRAFT_0511 [Rhizobium leguminosarum bv. trifolii WSM597]|uniref:CBS domain-containing protein n=1 Tax=Rhizobium leguminosarum bv. trifolii WSM597 TaxID=754764 RepID=I9N4Z5_RHILT|nr:hypothetical protein [Rhizobium leguminosarum]EJB01767.1 hypothetical protein Rleg9DRAFT_0511 [Rhizobium leguminosarum bv. trifolii WSM597]
MSDTSGDYLIKLAEERGKLSRLVMGGAAWMMGGALVVSSIGLAVWAFGNHELTPLVNIFDKLVTGILALVGAWVGAVIAFYFARDNFESASTQAQKSFGMSQNEQLAAIKVTDMGVMIDVSTALKLEVDPSDFDATVLQTAFIAPMAAKGYKRMPIFNKSGGVGLGVLHLSTINEYLVKLAVKPAAAPPSPPSGRVPTVEDATLGDLVKSLPTDITLQSAVAFVPRTATLLDVQIAMKSQNDSQGKSGMGCEDVFVTSNGDSKEKVIGWITNVKLREKAAFAG